MGRENEIRAFIIHGRVQGVMFRAWASEEAKRLGIRGFVRNQPNGTVEALLAGTPEAVTKMTELLQVGPPGAKVERLEKVPPPTEQVPDGFQIFSTGKFATESDAEELLVKPEAVSDRALRDPNEDVLGFRHYVHGVVAFLKSKETEPPLAIAISGRWGRGKTSFMNLIDFELRKKEWFAPVRFATAWFNPWKFNYSHEVWLAYIALVTKCIRGALTPWGRLLFEVRRFITNLGNRFTLDLLLRLLILLVLGFLFFWVTFDPEMREVTLAVIKEFFGANVELALERSKMGQIIPTLGAIVLIYHLYFKIIKNFNLGLLEHLRSTNPRNKVRTLTEFEGEMKHLNSCIPQNLKLVIFIDDLDRCKPSILLEMIEALQLLEISRRCIYVLGMDLNIVARTIEEELPQLRGAVEALDDDLQHGSGYQFLEKIIQTRLSVPDYGQDKVKDLVSNVLLTRQTSVNQPEEITTSVESKKSMEDLNVKSAKARKRIPEDSRQVRRAIEHYGPTYFDNPRRLKRFVNNFRFHAYLADRAGLVITTDILARFLVLAEKWPGLVEFFRNNPALLDKWPDFVNDREEVSKSVCKLVEDDLVNSLIGKESNRLTGKRLTELCRWYGFQFVQSKRVKGVILQ